MIVDFPPDQFVTEKGVAILDENEGARSHKGKPLKIDAQMLSRIAHNQNYNYKFKKCPVFVGLGHTKEGEEVSEEDQPPIVAYATNLRVEPFLNTGKKALYADIHFKREHESVIRDFPGRSVELYPGSEEIPFLALLRKVPERNLPVIKFSADRSDEDCCRITFTLPDPPTLLDSEPVITFSRESKTMPNDGLDPNPAVADAQLGEGKSIKDLAAEVADLKQMLMGFIQELQGALAEPEGEEGDDLLAPAGEGEGKDPETEDKPEEKPEPEKKGEEEPVKMTASAPSATNTFVPNTKNEDKTKMSRETEEALKFQKETAIKFAKVEKENEELRIKCNRMKAEKVVAELETKDKIKFGRDEDKKGEIELMANLDDESFDAHVTRIKTFYSRHTPDSKSVLDKLQFARTPEGEVVESMEDVQKRVEKRLGQSYADALKSK